VGLKQVCLISLPTGLSGMEKYQAVIKPVNQTNNKKKKLRHISFSDDQDNTKLEKKVAIYL
jgi:hypothetical protein